MSTKAGQLQALYHTGADGLISSTTSEGTSYYSYNTHSDASLLTDESGNTTSELHYDAWGNTSEETTEPNAYLGKHQRRTNHQTGLIKMGARFYSPETGRFISRDPLKGIDEIPISRNPYVYAFDDPVNKTDLLGMDAYSDYLFDEAYKYYYLSTFEFLSQETREQLIAIGDYFMQRAAEHLRIIGEEQNPPPSTSPAQKPQDTSCPETDAQKDHENRQKVIDAARSQLGLPYAWGGKYKNGAFTMNGLDCSGLVQYAFTIAFNQDFSSVESTWDWYDKCHEGNLDQSSAKPGDLVFYHDQNHVAIFLGGGQIIEEPHTGGSCQIASIGRPGSPEFKRPKLFYP